MLLIDVTHTSHTAARTGIQRVARSIALCLGPAALGVTRDPYLRVWRPLEPWERSRLADSAGGNKRRAQWPARSRWRGRIQHALGRSPRFALRGTFNGLIEPELFGPPVARDLPRLMSLVQGPRIALFHDAIALRHPELTPAGTVARMPAYLQELLRFDGIAANSNDSRDALLGYWRWLGVDQTPPVEAIPLAVDAPVFLARRVEAGAGVRPIVLSVGTIEGRKNHLALLEACEQLWAAGRDFELRMIGHVNTATGAPAFARLRELQAAGRPLRYDGPSSDEAIAAAYDECAFTVYPSVGEGFGLPVIESLVRGKPCVCSAGGALGEISLRGGCVALTAMDAPSLASGVTRLLDSPAELAALATAAAVRRFKSWAEYTNELTTWMRTLPRRS